jgi:hypothetical protein
MVSVFPMLGSEKGQLRDQNMRKWAMSAKHIRYVRWRLEVSASLNDRISYPTARR